MRVNHAQKGPCLFNNLQTPFPPIPFLSILYKRLWVFSAGSIRLRMLSHSEAARVGVISRRGKSPHPASPLQSKLTKNRGGLPSLPTRRWSFRLSTFFPLKPLHRMAHPYQCTRKL